MDSVIVLLLIGAILLTAATVAGLAGFGFSVIATISLTLLRGPQEAIALSLPALFVVNMSLAAGLDKKSLSTCARRFFPFITTVTVGGIVGLVALASLPKLVVVPVIIAITMATVFSQQQLFQLPFLSATKQRCFVEHNLAMAGIGLLGGLIFGATNIGLLVVSYLKSCSLPQSIFAGVVGISLLGTTALRFALGFGVGLYPSFTIVGLALGGMPIAAVGTALGNRLQNRLPKVWVRRFVLALLTLISARLTLSLL